MDYSDGGGRLGADIMGQTLSDHLSRLHIAQAMTQLSWHLSQ